MQSFAREQHFLLVGDRNSLVITAPLTPVIRWHKRAVLSDIVQSFLAPLEAAGSQNTSVTLWKSGPPQLLPHNQVGV